VADWRRSNRDIVAELLRVQKAVRRGAERRRVTARDLARLLDRHRGRCAYCAVPVVPGTSLHWDHIIPIIRGGRHAIGNLAPACPTCNTRKGALTVMEWRIRVY
jgi:5-methylcytosine-specific restriction endonuclease McrA